MHQFVYCIDLQLDLPVFIHALHAVIDCIFQKRLDHQLGTQAVRQFFVPIHRKCKLILKPHILNGKIADSVFQFLLQRDNVLPLTQGDAEKFCQHGHHFSGALILFALYHPDNGVQRVIQKVGIDLRLQQLSLGDLFFPFLFPHSFHQLIRLFRHVIKAVGKSSDLSVALCFCTNLQFPMSEPFHGFGEPQNRCDHQTLNQKIQYHRNHRHQQNNDCDSGSKLCAVLQFFRQRSSRDQFPAGISYGLLLEQPLLFVLQNHLIFRCMQRPFGSHTALQSFLKGIADQMLFVIHQVKIIRL